NSANVAFPTSLRSRRMPTPEKRGKAASTRAQSRALGRSHDCVSAQGWSKAGASGAFMTGYPFAEDQRLVEDFVHVDRRQPGVQLCEVRERVVECVERLTGRHREADRLLGGQVVDLDARAVVLGVPVEGDLEPAAGALVQLATGEVGEVCDVHGQRSPCSCPGGADRVGSAG